MWRMIVRGEATYAILPDLSPDTVRNTHFLNLVLRFLSQDVLVGSNIK